VFFDLIGSTAIAEKISAVDFNTLLSSCFDTVMAFVEKQRGLSDYSPLPVLRESNLRITRRSHAQTGAFGKLACGARWMGFSAEEYRRIGVKGFWGLISAGIKLSHARP
jgi:hypothetical protein